MLRGANLWDISLSRFVVPYIKTREKDVNPQFLSIDNFECWTKRRLQLFFSHGLLNQGIGTKQED